MEETYDFDFADLTDYEILNIIADEPDIMIAFINVVQGTWHSAGAADMVMDHIQDMGWPLEFIRKHFN